MKKLLSTTALVLTLAFTGAAYAHSGEHEWHKGSDYYSEQAISRLPSEKASEFRDNMKKSEEDNKELMRQKMQKRRELHAILTAPTFDKSAFLSKTKELRNLHDEIEENKTNAFASAAEDLSQKERKMLMGSMRDMHHKRMTHTGNHQGQYPTGPVGTVKQQDTTVKP